MADAPKPTKGTVTINPRVLMAGGAVALVGVVMLAAFLWMVPNAAAREEKAACRGLKGDLPLNPILCKGPACNAPIPAPELTALDHDGKPVKLSQFRGKVVLLNFWASWCGVCKTEKPSLRAIADELSSRDDFAVITVASDHEWSDVLLAMIGSLAPGYRLPRAPEGGTVPLAAALDAYRQALPAGVPFKVFLDPPDDGGNIGASSKSWGINKVPESILIDRAGNIRAYFVNKRDWSTSVAHTCLRSVLDE